MNKIMFVEHGVCPVLLPDCVLLGPNISGSRVNDRHLSRLKSSVITNSLGVVAATDRKEENSSKKKQRTVERRYERYRKIIGVKHK